MNRTAHGMRAACLALAALAAWTASAPAHAQDRYAAAVGNFSYTLTDLAPSDGVAPAANFDAPIHGYLRDGLDVTQPGQAPISLAHDLPLTGPATTGWDLPYAHMGAAYLDHSTVAAASIAPLAGASISLYQSTAAEQFFSLAPHTAITLSADGVIDLVVDPSRSAQLGSTAAAFATAVFTIQGPGDFLQSGQVDGGASNDPQAGEASALQRAELITLNWRNDSDQWQDGQLDWSAFLVAWSRDDAVSPVPEPGQWAMLGVGMGLLGWRARRSMKRT